MNFVTRLNKVLQEMGKGPHIVAARFIPTKPGRYGAEVTYQDGLVEIVFDFDPEIASFAPQELVGLTKQEALWLKDRKTDDAVGIENPI